MWPVEIAEYVRQMNAALRDQRREAQRARARRR
jgi:hypothetical protein